MNSISRAVSFYNKSENISLNIDDVSDGIFINSIDGIELFTMNDLKEYIYTKKTNDTVTLNVSRGKISKEISIVLGKK